MKVLMNSNVSFSWLHAVFFLEEEMYIFPAMIIYISKKDKLLCWIPNGVNKKQQQQKVLHDYIFEVRL